MDIDDKLLDEMYAEIDNVIDDGYYKYNPKLGKNIENGSYIEMNTAEIKRHLDRWYLVKLTSFAIKDGLNQLDSFSPELSSVPGAVLRLFICYLRNESEVYFNRIFNRLRYPQKLKYEHPMILLMKLQQYVYENNFKKMPTVIAKLLLWAGYNNNPELYTNIEREILEDYIILQIATNYGMTRKQLMGNCFPNFNEFKEMKFQEKLDIVTIYSERFSWNEF